MAPQALLISWLLFSSLMPDELQMMHFCREIDTLKASYKLYETKEAFEYESFYQCLERAKVISMIKCS